METNTTSDAISMQYNILPTKKEIIQRLFKEEKISFDEMWVLLQDNENVRYVPMPQPVIIQQPYPYPAPFQPYNPPFGPTFMTSNSAGLSTITNKINNGTN